MSDRLIGATLGEFRIEELVGRGAVGRVYRAVQESLNRRVALKVLEEGLFTPDEFKARFEREARVIAALEHPNIIPVYAYGHQPPYFFYAMRLVEGPTLDARLGAGLSMRDGLRHLADVAAGLAYAHERDVVHRDLKPANIMIADDVAMLGDFGLARLMKDPSMTASGALIGTPRYMAPEQARRERVGPPADLYALGVILYEVACGRHPFAEDGENDPRRRALAQGRIMKRILDGDFPPPAAPAPLAELIRRLMALKPEDRVANAAEVRERLVEFATQPEITSARPRAIGRYELISRIGDGKTWRARDTQSGRVVALKVHPPGERGGASRPPHDAIVPILDSGEHEGRKWEASELVDGECVKTLLARGPMASSRAMEILRDAARVLEVVPHGDVHAGNILIDRGGQVRLTDFAGGGDDVGGLKATLKRMLDGGAPDRGAAAIAEGAYPTVTDFREDVERYLAGEPIRAGRRSPAVKVAVTGVAVLVLIGIGLLWMDHVGDRSAAAALAAGAADRYRAAEYGEAEARARSATERDDDWGPGWFWLARVRLRQAEAFWTVPSARIVTGRVQVVARSVPADAAEMFARATEGEGLEEWQGRMAAGDWEAAAEEGEWEARALAAIGAYGRGDSEAAAEHARRGRETWGGVAWFREMEAQARIAQGLQAALEGGDPMPRFEEARRCVAEGRALAPTDVVWDSIEGRLRELIGR